MLEWGCDVRPRLARWTGLGLAREEMQEEKKEALKILRGAGAWKAVLCA